MNRRRVIGWAAGVGGYVALVAFVASAAIGPLLGTSWTHILAVTAGSFVLAALCVFALAAVPDRPVEPGRHRIPDLGDVLRHKEDKS